LWYICHGSKTKIHSRLILVQRYSIARTYEKTYGNVSNYVGQIA
jgi:hypothetical protein